MVCLLLSDKAKNTLIVVGVLVFLLFLVLAYYYLRVGAVNCVPTSGGEQGFSLSTMYCN
jgi:hypothetical protein